MEIEDFLDHAKIYFPKLSYLESLETFNTLKDNLYRPTGRKALCLKCGQYFSLSEEGINANTIAQFRGRWHCTYTNGFPAPLLIVNNADFEAFIKQMPDIKEPEPIPQPSPQPIQSSSPVLRKSGGLPV